MDVRDDEMFLMLMPATKQVFPVAGGALNATQSTRKELDNCMGSLLIDNVGRVKKIIDIKKIGLYGNTFIQKLRSATFGVYSIRTELETVQYEFPELIEMISQFIENDLDSHDPIFETIRNNKQTALADIKKAESIDQIFSILQMSEASDCLDML